MAENFEREGHICQRPGRDQRDRPPRVLQGIRKQIAGGSRCRNVTGRAVRYGCIENEVEGRAKNVGKCVWQRVGSIGNRNLVQAK